MGIQIGLTGLVVTMVTLFGIVISPRNVSNLAAFLLITPFFGGIIAMIIGTLMWIWGC